MKPPAKHIEYLEKFDAQTFASWLRKGFEDIHSESNRIMSFAPLNYFVGRRGDLISELKDIYDALSGSARENFRVGIAIALSNLPPSFSSTLSISSVPTMRGLLHLAGRVHATEVLPIVIQQVGNGFFGMPQYSEGQELFALVLDIIAGMSPANFVFETVRRMVASSFFRYGYAPRAFIALCRAEPEKFPEHLDLLRSSFNELHRHAVKDDSFITARRFVQYVDTEVIAKNLWKVDFNLNPNVDPLSTDNWLGFALFVNNSSPLRVIEVSKHFVITRSEKSSGERSYGINLEVCPSQIDHIGNFRAFLSYCVLRNENKRVLQRLKREFLYLDSESEINDKTGVFSE